MLPLQDTPWIAEQSVLIILALIGQAGLIVVTLLTRNSTGKRLTAIEDSTSKTAVQVTNSHKTNLRDDITAVAKSVKKHRDDTAESLAEVGNAIAEMRSEFQSHVKTLGAEQAKQTTLISSIENAVARQAETTAANEEAANIVHAGIFRRLSLLENASEKFHKWKNVWPWQAQNLEPPTR